MKALLDTHIVLWYVTDDNKLRQEVIDLIENQENQIYISIASLWEMSIKASIGKLNLTQPIEDFIGQNIHLLPIGLEHITAIQSLPFHHRDPFDRMLIAQSMVENLVLVSEDSQFKNYEINLF
jgi:PIN domain nuclease of toxin-antitoxin system